MSPKILGLIAILIASLLWSTAGVAAKWLVAGVSPIVATFYRFGLAFLLILPFFLFSPKPKGYLKRLIPFSLLGSLNVILFYLGIKNTTANTASLIYAATPLATAILAALMLREQITKHKLWGILVGFLGILLISLLPLFEHDQTISGDFGGNLLILLAMLSWTVYSIYLKRILNLPQYTPVLATSVLFLTTAVSAFVLALFTQQSFISPQFFTTNYLTTLFYTAIFITLITFLLFQWAVKRISITTASFKNYLEPVIALWLNHLFLGEEMSLGLLVGSALVIFGVVIATQNYLSRLVK